MRGSLNIFIIVISLVMIGLVSASNPSMGTFKINSCFEIPQSCFINGSICDYCNISSVAYPNGSLALTNAEMEQREADFNYTYCDSDALGRYDVRGYCSYGSTIKKPFVAYFDITTTGAKVSLSNIILVIVFLVLSTLCFFLGYSFDVSKWIIKSSLNLFSLLFGLLAINSARIIASESLDLGTMGNAGMLIAISLISFFFLYVFIYWTIETFRSIKEKQGVRWR